VRVQSGIRNLAIQFDGMPKQAAGILVYRKKNKCVEAFLVHPGGPLHKNKDLGSWQIPKGEFENDEQPFDAAKREFKEETGQEVDGNFFELKPVKYKSGKIVYAWAVEGNVDEKKIASNLFSMEWPPRSGRQQEFPEVDRGEWFSIVDARRKILPALVPFLEELEEKIR
jgi:predicted NUDIX family NTP pyrophosphohydrolase